ncbi:hypothetical protein F3Y22_tig00111769pilonHSYRG00722 [Hibiscus syriacus]|uniref:Uncharacterized protein n=1 Tax=Hibiscus syriacus TaxID=106335 RepID=A0A6A2YHK3_HIBSY|nr:uncharacterized protein LOC120169585 [Hibiscus syriacus]KAE8674274.1 hypothetical protein F3Y22_tig00111769pilonHSYRG00722 [Hibiscus syriacus]
MKASLKFREEKKPVLRAKIPLSILGPPFQSGIVAGDSKEFALNLSTFFESGPSIKIAYRPNDTWSPFSLIIKTGTGAFGSPVSSSMLMSAEFNLLGRGNPSFMLHFKPQFGDFSIKKSQSSVFDKAVKPSNGGVLEDDSLIEVVDFPAVSGDSIGFFADKRKLAAFNSKDFAGILSGMEIAARTAVPVKGKALVKFRWGMRIPSEMKSGVGGIADPKTGFSLAKIPFLVMEKIGIEHVDGTESKQDISTASKSGPEAGPNSDAAEVCYTIKRQLEALKSENGSLRRAVEELRHEISMGKYREFERTSISKPKTEREETMRRNQTRMERGNKEKKSVEGDLSGELKKALKGAGGP